MTPDFLKKLFKKSALALGVVSPAVPADLPNVGAKGEFRARIIDVDGTVLEDFKLGNAATYEGLNSLLNTGFRGVTQITTYYCYPINGSGFSAVSVNDTAASHSGWTELTSYSESVRQTWSPGAASAGVITNSTAMSFTINTSTVSIQGIAIQTTNTKSSTSGVLWATAVDSSARTLTNGQTFQVYYTVTLTPIS